MSLSSRYEQIPDSRNPVLGKLAAKNAKDANDISVLKAFFTCFARFADVDQRLQRFTYAGSQMIRE